MHLHQPKYVCPGFAQLQGQFLHLVLGYAQEGTTGLKLSWAAKSVAGVFDFEGIHGHALSVLFGYTVIDAQASGEGEATISRVLDWCSVGRTPEVGFLLWTFFPKRIRFGQCLLDYKESQRVLLFLVFL
ncbi:hypothetical protein [Pseudomonas sp. DR48]|uniref:hypothetical protein n=1 Tax=Pseudomonas sp. DR48 TaxID=2871095 RepID=UPI0021BD5B84|nr:hypothetical protein [Pseudomonas sp. DR48]